MDQPGQDWFPFWMLWAPVSALIGGIVSYIVSVTKLRQQFVDHLTDACRREEMMERQITQLHGENRLRLEEIRADIRELRLTVMKLIDRYQGPERGH